jgi:hypothetical protein
MGKCWGEMQRVSPHSPFLSVVINILVYFVVGSL